MYYSFCRAATHVQVKFRSKSPLQPHDLVEDILKVAPVRNTATTITLVFVCLEISVDVRNCPSAVGVVCCFHKYFSNFSQLTRIMRVK